MVCIFICGVGGSGKSTLARELLNSNKKLKDLNKILNVPRNVLQELKVNRREKLEDYSFFYHTQETILQKQCILEKTYHDNGKDVISDNTVLDGLMHASIKINQDAEERLMSSNPMIEESLLRYRKCLVVLLSPLPDVADDGIRLAFSDEELEKVNNLYTKFCRQYKIPVLKLGCATLEDRIKVITEALEGKLPLQTSSLSNYNTKTRVSKIPENTSLSFFLHKPNKPGCISVPIITVKEHKSEQEWKTWEQDETNRFIAKYSEENLVIVSFHVSVKSKVVQKMLLDGITINGEEYSFLGCSSSGLKKRKCYMLKGSQEKADKLIEENGRFDKNSVAKRMARIGLLFSAVRLTDVKVRVDEIITEDDIKTRDGKCFTDGCGGIGHNLAKQLYSQASRGLSVDENYLPSVYQIRYQGYKGVLALDPMLPLESIKVRPSMKKFETTAHERIGVCGFSRPHTFGHLNRQYIMLLSGLGVPDKYFIEKQEKHFKMVEKMTTDLESAITILQWQNKFELAQRLMNHRASSWPDDEVVKRAIRRTQSKLVSVSQKLRILIPKSRNIYGVCDPTGTLKYGQCFLRITEGNVGSPKTIKGQVIVSKNPCYLLGDVRVLTAVNSPETKQLNHLVDCIVFPVCGERPHPDEIAGSDLDGDMFFVSWDSDLIPSKTKQPYEYPSAEGKPQGKITFEKMVKYFADQNESQKLTAQVDRQFLQWANIKGVRSEECVRLGMLFSRVIDSAKSGEKIDRQDLLAPNDKDLEASEQKYVWQILENNAKLFIDKFAERVVSKEEGFPAASEVNEEFVQVILTQDMSNISEFQKFEFAWSYVGTITQDWEERVQIFLHKFADNLNFALFSIQQKHEAVSMGIPEGLVTNALRKSKLLSKDDIDAFAMTSSANQWKFYFREDHENFNWNYLLKALTQHDRCLLVVSLPDEVTLVLQFLTKLKLGEKQQVEPGIISGYLYSKRFQYREKYVLGPDYSMDLTESRLQLYRNQNVAQTFVWLKATDLKKDKHLHLCDELLNSISVDLVRFRKQILNGPRRHPLVNKIPLVTVEVFLDNKGLGVPYFDTFEANDLEPIAETKDLEEEEDYDTERDLSHMVAEENWCACETEEELKASLKRTVTEGKPLLFKRFLDDWLKGKSYTPSFVTELFISLLENIVTQSTPQDLPKQVKGALKDVIPICDFQQMDQLFTTVGHLSRLHLEDLTTALLIHGIDNRELDISCFLNIYSNWQIWWYVERDFAQQILSNVATTVSSCHVSNEVTSDALKTIRYVLHFGQLHFLDLLEEIEAVKERLKSEKADFSICNLKVKKTNREDDVGVLSFYRASSLDHRPRITQGQFVAVTRQADFKKMKNHKSCCCLAQVESIRPAPLTVTLKLFGQVPAIVSESLSSDTSRLWKIDLIANITTFTRVMNALKRLLKAGNVESSLLDVLVNPAGHPRNSTLFSDKTAIEIPDREVIEDSELEVSHCLNETQRQAVIAALKQNLTLIQGPPGTGKTTLACEIVKQAHKMKRYKKILVVAETNVAVDNITKKLRKDLPLDILRLGTEGGIDRDVYDLTLDGQLRKLEEKEAKKTSYRDERGIVHRKPKLVEKILSSASIFLTTCAGAGESLLDSQTFEFVLVDEATQTKETTLLCSLVHGVKKLVMIGDPKQLGPVISEQHNKKSCEGLPDLTLLSKTLFHRLYDVDVIPTSFLDTQHRMHPELMAFPSQTFYDGKLKCGDLPYRCLPAVFVWPDPEKPLCFVNVESKEQRSGTSFCNREEVCVVQLVLDLLLNVPEDKRELRLDVNGIGVLTLYQGQARLLSSEIKPKVEVRTVDGFQGREKEVIIVSTVRANDSRALGFLDSTNRLNVLLTRAKRGLIVVGNKETLRNSQLWSKWIEDAPKLDRFSLESASSSRSQASSFGGHQDGQAAARDGRDKRKRDQQASWDTSNRKERSGHAKSRDSRANGRGRQRQSTVPRGDTNQIDRPDGNKTSRHGTSRGRGNQTDSQDGHGTSRGRGNQTGSQDGHSTSRGRANQTDRQDGHSTSRGRANQTDRQDGQGTSRGRGNETDRQDGHGTSRGRGNETDRQEGHRTSRGRGNQTDRQDGHSTSRGRANQTDRQDGHSTSRVRGNQTDRQDGHDTSRGRANQTDRQDGHSTSRVRGNQTDRQDGHSTSRGRANQTDRQDS